MLFEYLNETFTVLSKKKVSGEVRLSMINFFLFWRTTCLECKEMSD